MGRKGHKHSCAHMWGRGRRLCTHVCKAPSPGRAGHVRGRCRAPPGGQHWTRVCSRQGLNPGVGARPVPRHPPRCRVKPVLAPGTPRSDTCWCFTYVPTHPCGYTVHSHTCLHKRHWFPCAERGMWCLCKCVCAPRVPGCMCSSTGGACSWARVCEVCMQMHSKGMQAGGGGGPRMGLGPQGFPVLCGIHTSWHGAIPGPGWCPALPTRTPVMAPPFGPVSPTWAQPDSPEPVDVHEAHARANAQSAAFAV